MKEEWRDVPEYEGYYQVSNFGRVRSIERFVTDGKGTERKRLFRGRILKPSKNKFGYLSIVLSYNGKQKTARIHKLVAECFPEICGTWLDGCVVDHLDGNKLNNNAENLRVCSYKENNNNPITLERLKKVQREESYKEKQRKAFTNRKDQSKPVLQYTKDGVLIAEFPSVSEAERQTGIHNSNICACCLGRPKHKTAGGYVWKFVFAA